MSDLYVVIVCVGLGFVAACILRMRGRIEDPWGGQPGRPDIGEVQRMVPLEYIFSRTYRIDPKREEDQALSGHKVILYHGRLEYRCDMSRALISERHDIGRVDATLPEPELDMRDIHIEDFELYPEGDAGNAGGSPLGEAERLSEIDAAGRILEGEKRGILEEYRKEEHLAKAREAMKRNVASLVRAMGMEPNIKFMRFVKEEDEGLRRGAEAGARTQKRELNKLLLQLEQR